VNVAVLLKRQGNQDLTLAEVAGLGEPARMGVASCDAIPLRIGRRTATVEYGMVACAIALLATACTFLGALEPTPNSALKVSDRNAQFAYVGPLTLTTPLPFRQGLTAQAWRVQKLELADGALP
jgi:hypothetical protein